MSFIVLKYAASHKNAKITNFDLATSPVFQRIIQETQKKKQKKQKKQKKSVQKK